MNVNTRTIGINTEINLMNTRCIKCFQENNYSKFAFMPHYIPFPYPFYNPMMYPQFQNNFMDCSNICFKCENQKYFNPCNSQHCLHNCSSSSSSSCKNCGSRTCCAPTESNQVHQTISDEIVQNLEENHEEKLNVLLRSSNHHLKEDREESLKETPDSNEVEEISNTKSITKYANEFLEKNYRSKYAFKSVNETENIEEKTEHQNQNNEKQLITRLLKPNTKKRPNNRNIAIEEIDDSDINVESDNENISDEDDNDYSGQTVIEISQKDVNKGNIEDRRPRRININDQTSATHPNQDKDVGMLLMLKALVNPYDDKNSPCLNKLLNHIGNENARPKTEMRKSKSTSPRRNVINKNYSM